MLAFILLIILAFIFPPMWFGVLFYILWLILTRKKRRNQAIINKLSLLILSSKNEIFVDDIYWESFCSFVHDLGGHGNNSYARTRYDHDNLILPLDVDGKKYIFFFSNAEAINKVYISYNEV
ncbi:MAG: hypothetical protein Q4D05_08610 [Acinetobacter sp.]|nr:hypothetical protein [Acinetobacter sp.]